MTPNELIRLAFAVARAVVVADAQSPIARTTLEVCARGVSIPHFPKLLMILFLRFVLDDARSH